MTSSASSKPRERPYVEFRSTRLYFDTRFYIASALAVISILISIFADGATGLGRAGLTLVGLLGVLIGVLFQPAPKPADHTPKARQALQVLSTAQNLVRDVRTVGNQLREFEIEVRTKVGLANMDTDLHRVQDFLKFSMAEWDEIAPGAVDEFRSTSERGSEILRTLSAEEGKIDE